jgi:diadenosine tetraphosphate (Ap4A) HIT family hydrolase
MFMKSKRIANALQHVFKTDWIIADTGGIGVPHAHVHLIPRYEDDGHGELPDPKILREISEEEMTEIARKIKAEIEKLV